MSSSVAPTDGSGPAAMSLSPAAQTILGRIETPELRTQVEEATRLALVALADLKRIHLPQEHFEVSATRGSPDKHVELAPYVLAAVASINRLLGYLAETFPAPASAELDMGGGDDMDDFDFDFDLVDEDVGSSGGGGNGAAEPAKEMTPEEKVGDAANAFGSMLRSRVMTFADRLEHALSQQDSWPMLAEIDDNHHRLIKSVQGVLFGVLGVFADKERRDEVLPEYRSAVSSATQLRAAVTELSFHISRFNSALAGADADTCVPLVVGISDRLKNFAGRREYRVMRAEDKKVVIDFRRALHQMRYSKDKVPMVRLRQNVEGFSKFLESMQAINHREVLVLHDKQRLEEALSTLEGVEKLVGGGSNDIAAPALKGLVDHLGAVFGRNPDLDDRIRDYRQYASADSLPVPTNEDLAQWRGAITNALMTVG